MRTITKEMLENYKLHLINEEKATATIEKYVRDVAEFAEWLGVKELEKSTALAYKTELTQKYAPASVNAALSSLNSFFAYMEWYDLRVKNLKFQKQIFASTDKELTKSE